MRSESFSTSSGLRPILSEFFYFLFYISGPQICGDDFVNTVLVELPNFAGCDLFLCLCGVTITNYKNSLFMSIKDIMDLSHVLCCYYDLYRKYPRYTQLSPPHGPHSGRFLLYCIYQYKQRIERSCVQQKLAIINNIQIFCMIEQNKIFSVKS
jgi:hypothetical protein